MNIYYEILPVDTLFFRGAEPLEAGQLASTGLFPPPVTVITGALRTAVLKQKNVRFDDYKNGLVSDDVTSLIGKCGTNVPFSVTAVLLKKSENIYAPAPYSWFIDSAKKPVNGGDYAGLKVYPAEYCDAGVLKQLGIVDSAKSLPLVVLKNDAVCLGGNWVRLELLQRKDQITLSQGDILTPKELYGTENRTGISLLEKETDRPTRQVREGALYTAGHIRLADGVSIVIGIDRECGLTDNGMLTLGGEQRMSSYQKFTMAIKHGNTGRFIALSPIKADTTISAKTFCVGKQVMVAGWDLAKKFHKDSETWFPAGSVFTENINNQCWPIAQ
ncbi:MAG TPA: type III-B CRISPR module-associated Cmr3 family protein [Chitinispirillaceae bacterium]|nr:type III-B CRISPR module-associated Cmr3 family protein [Chitinispirillaceae bacterium]